VRATCPTCRSKWPGRKDPCEEDAKTLMSLRIGDLVKGLSVHSTSILAMYFEKDGETEHACQRLMELTEAKYIIQRCLDKVEDAERSLAATPLVMGLIQRVAAAPTEWVEDGLERWPAIRTLHYRVIAAGDVLRVQELEEIEDDD